MSEFKPWEEREGEPSLSARDLIETIFLVGVGAATLARERLGAAVDDLATRGRLNGEAAQAVWARVAGGGRHKAGTGADQIDGRDIDFRLRQIEHRLRLLESRVDRCTEDKDS